MNNVLAKKFSFPALVLFALPNIVMMVFLSLYTIIDGMFISRYAGTVALSAINMSYPLNCIEMAIGIMLATGGSAIIAIRMGEGKEREAKENFTCIVMVSLLTGIVLAIAGNLFMNQLMQLLGVSTQQFAYCKVYTSILVAFSPAFFLQTAFQVLFVTAGKPQIGLAATIAGGITNIVLDYVFIAVCGWGIAGAAIATGIGYCIPALIGMLYFTFCRTGSLYFVRFRVNGNMLLNACANGSSEMVTNIANAVTTFLFNFIFMKYYLEDGVASITIVLYFQFVFTAVYFGFSMGVAPIISYKYGQGDKEQLKKVYKNSMLFIVLCSLLSYLLSRIMIAPALSIFTDRGSHVFQITMEGFPIYALGFLFMGVSTFASAYFTALSNGKVSAIISFVRTFLFLAGAIVLLPILFGAAGIWYAVPVAEGLGIAVSVYYLKRKGAAYLK